MKYSLSLTGGLAAAMLALTPQINAQSVATTPVGYTTETLKQGFNLIGLTLHNPVIASGTIDSVTSDSVTENDLTFTDEAILGTSGSATYILEITSGDLSGSIQDITEWTANALTTPDDLEAAGLVSGTTFKIRKAATIADVFGEDNSAGLQGVADFNASNADLVYIPNSSGGFDQFFYSTNSSSPGQSDGWFKVQGFIRSSDQPIIYTDSLLVLRRDASEVDLIVTGEVKSTATSVFIEGGAFSYISGIYPTGTTLDSSGLQSGLTGVADFNPSNADLLYLPNSDGGYDQYFYSTNNSSPGQSDGWFKVQGFQRSNDQELASGMLVFRRGDDTTASITGPSLD